jgi:RNA polymerase sigma-70 factor (ECF subfamily)
MSNQDSKQLSIDDLVDRYGEELLRYLWRYLKSSPVNAEDCLQETYLKAIRGFPALSNHDHLRAWMYRIATNVANTRLSEARRREQTEAASAAHASERESSVEDMVRMRLDLEAVAAAVNRLPERQKAAFLMRKYQSLSYDEIAASLGCSRDSARANVYQALRSLRDQFDREMEA